MKSDEEGRVRLPGRCMVIETNVVNGGYSLWEMFKMAKWFQTNKEKLK